MVKWFEELSAVNVNEHIKQKNGLNYLSWMWAWQELKKKFPLSYATVHETEDGMLVWRDPIGCHVKTSITLVWSETDAEGNEVLKEHTATEYLPVMDFRNKAVPYENVDAMMVNKTVQRSLTKCIARLGLGSYIFVDEDLPEEEKKENEKNFYCFFSHFLLRVSFKVPAAVSSYPLHQSPVGEHQQKNDEQAADKFPAGQPFRKSRKKQGSFSEKIQRQKAAKLSRRNLSIF